jgi:hypothetical protein
MTFIGHMCDPHFVGANPPVQSIHAAYNLLSRQDTPPGIHKLWADAVLTVLTGPMDGFSVDTRLVFTLAEQADGHLRIRTIREVEKLKRGDRSVEEASWGSIKALYR